MAYERTIWKNREVERPRTYEKIENPDGTITLLPSEGTIIEEGTPIIAENMNKIEQGIQDAHDELAAHTSYAIATGTNSYAVNIQGITALTEGMSIKVRFQNTNTGACTLNVNNLGSKTIKKSNGNDLVNGNIKAGQICHLVYTGSVFQLLGEGGEYGTAQTQHVLSPYTIGTEEGIKSGTMPDHGNKIWTPNDSTQTGAAGYYSGITVNPRPALSGNATTSQVLSGGTFYGSNYTKQTGTMTNRGAVTNTITTQGGQYTIPAGYHSGSGKVTASFANLVAANIKKGVNIGGVVGNLEEKQISVGTISYISTNSIKWVGLNFEPRIVVAYAQFYDAAGGSGAMYSKDHNTLLNDLIDSGLSLEIGTHRVGFRTSSVRELENVTYHIMG